MRTWFLSILLFCTASLKIVAEDSIPVRKGFVQKVMGSIYGFVKEFSRIDTCYIEPQHYNFTIMLQNTNTYEMYRLQSKDGNSITFSPQPTTRIGPYLGWRWVFLGYQLDINHLSDGHRKKEFDISLYSSQIGIDLFYRKTGNDYRIRRMNLGEDINTQPLRNVNYDGLNASIKGFNLYYIFNHRRFSYPAAFSQSTIQRKSCGSPLIGIGYTKHSLSVDWSKLDALVEEKLGSDVAKERIDESLIFEKVQYADFSISGGYAYNWVFAHNWLFAASLSLALGYKQTKGESRHDYFSLRDFSMSNFSMDGVGRFGLVWNNARWYAGTSTILHSYNYNKKQFSTNNFFGNVNIYVGLNFSKKKSHKHLQQ